MNKTKKVAEPTLFALDLIKDYINKFCLDSTKQRSLDLINGKNGFSKWYSMNYGYPINKELFKAVKVRDIFDVREKFSFAAERRNLDALAIACKSDGIEEASLKSFFSDIFCPPILILSRRKNKILDAFVMQESNLCYLSPDLWEALGEN